MKKILLITFTILTNISYASFPVVESNAKILAIQSEYDEDDEPSLLEAILMGVLVVSILGFAVYFLFRAWRDNIRWVKIVTYILLGFFLLFLILALILNAIFSGGSFM